MLLSTCHVDDLTGTGSSPGLPGAPDAAVVIDVVRAFTVAPWCLARGASSLLLAPSLDAAARARDERCPEALLLKDGGPDPRFALPNSPGRISREDLTGRTVIQKTGNGTRGAFAASAAPVVLCASFVNAGATVRAIVRLRAQRVLFVPTEGDEDHALADYLTALLETPEGTRTSVDPRPYLHRVEESRAGRECRARGVDPAYPCVARDDLDRCLELDAFDTALAVEPDGELLRLGPL